MPRTSPPSVSPATLFMAPAAVCLLAGLDAALLLLDLPAPIRAFAVSPRTPS